MKKKTITTGNRTHGHVCDKYVFNDNGEEWTLRSGNKGNRQ